MSKQNQLCSELIQESNCTHVTLRCNKGSNNAKKQQKLKVWFPATRRTQLAVSSMPITAAFALRLSVLDLRWQVIMCSITERWVLGMFALADGEHSLCTRHCPFQRSKARALMCASKHQHIMCMLSNMHFATDTINIPMHHQ